MSSSSSNSKVKGSRPCIYRFNPEKSLPKFGVLVFVGRTDSGKSWMQKEILYHIRKKYDVYVVMSGSKETSIDLENHIPCINIHDKLDLTVLQEIYEKQEELRERELRGGRRCPLLVLILDDVAYKRKSIVASEICSRIFFNCRHARILCLISIQDPKLITPALRLQARKIFVAQEKNKHNRKRIYDAFNPCFDDFEDFDNVMKMSTRNYEQLVLNNEQSGSDEVSDNVFYFKAQQRGQFKCNPGGKIWKKNKLFLDKKYQHRKKIDTDASKRATQPIYRSNKQYR